MVNTNINYKFISIFNFKNNESQKKFIDFAEGENGMKITKNFKGCVSINIYISKNTPNKLFIIEEWNNNENRKSYLEMRKKQGTYTFFETLVDKPIELHLISPISKL